MKLAVLGSGAWGTALAVTLSAAHRVTLWSRDAEQCRQMQTLRVNRRYLPDVALPADSASSLPTCRRRSPIANARSWL